MYIYIFTGQSQARNAPHLSQLYLFIHLSYVYFKNMRSNIGNYNEHSSDGRKRNSTASETKHDQKLRRLFPGENEGASEDVCPQIMEYKVWPGRRILEYIGCRCVGLLQTELEDDEPAEERVGSGRRVRVVQCDYEVPVCKSPI